MRILNNNNNNNKRGLQLVVLYLELDGCWRIPWGFRLWRGTGSASPGALLPLKLLLRAPSCQGPSPLATR